MNDAEIFAAGEGDSAVLMLRFLDGLSEDGEVATLNALLLEPTHRQTFVDLCRQRGQLVELLAPERSRAAEDKLNRHRHITFQRVALAAAAVLAVGVALRIYGRDPAIASLADVAGEAYLVTDSVAVVAQPGSRIDSGQGIRIDGLESHGKVVFPDGTSVQLDGDTELSSISEQSSGKSLFLQHGSLSAQVAHQKQGAPMRIRTPQGEVTVLGTTLKLTVDGSATRLEVSEGRTRITRAADGASVEVGSKEYVLMEKVGMLQAKKTGSAELVRAMRPGTWMSVPGTHLRTVLPDTKQYPRINGVSGPGALLGLSSAVLDTRRNQLLVWGGGNTSYYGNEIYSFSIEDLAWRRLTEPTADPALGKQVNADGTPAARNNYNGLAYAAHIDRMFACGGVLAGSKEGDEKADITWLFDPASATWHDMNPQGVRPPTSIFNVAAYDPASRKIWFGDCAHFGTDGPGLYSYDPAANNWSRHNNDYFARCTATVDTRRNLLVFVGFGEVFCYDLGNGEGGYFARQSWQTSGGDAVVSQDSPGLDYDPVADRIVAWCGGTVCSLDPDTKVWTQDHAEGAPAPTPHGIFGRWRYVPAVDAFIVVTDVDEDVHFYKMP